MRSKLVPPAAIALVALAIPSGASAAETFSGRVKGADFQGDYTLVGSKKKVCVSAESVSGSEPFLGDLVFKIKQKGKDPTFLDPEPLADRFCKRSKSARRFSKELRDANRVIARLFDVYGDVVARGTLKPA
jgi:hypothetical protein